MANKIGFEISDVSLPGGDRKENVPPRERIIEAVDNAGVKFWRDADHVAYATVPVSGTLHRYRVRSRAFGLMIRKLYGIANPVAGSTGRVRPGSVSDSAMAEAVTALEAIAFSGPAFVPTARIYGAPENIILDLGDDSWRAIKITADGWTVLDETEAPLIRPDGMRALPVPTRKSDALRTLRGLLNLPKGPEGDASFRLAVLWCTSCLWPYGPYALLAIDGEQGSAKSTTCRMLRRLVDPHAGELRAPPRNEDDLLIAALNGRVVAADNVSFIESDMADALCRLITGAGFGKRKLYADLDEVIVSVCRPVLLNGIPSLLARADMADRALAITLPAISDDARRPEADIWRDFETAAPAVLGLILDGLAMALRRLPTLKLTSLPRMADFTRFAVAAAPAFGWTEANVIDALASNREAAIVSVIEADAVAEAIRAFCPSTPLGWTGTATDLLSRLRAQVSADTLKERTWPKDASRLSNRITRVQPALRRAGVEIVTTRDKSSRFITIKAIPPTIGTERHQRHPASPSPGTNVDEEPVTLLVTARAGPASSKTPLDSAEIDADDAGDAVLTHPGKGNAVGDGAVTMGQRWWEGRV